MKKYFLFLIGIVIFVSGCATLPMSPEEQEQFDREIQRQKEQQRNYIPEPRFNK
jgi:hypothetical protein